MKYFYILLFGATILCSCESEIDLDIPLPNNDPQPIVICFASPTQPTLAYISKTIPVDATEPDTSLVEVMSVEIVADDNQVIGTLLPTSTKGLYASPIAIDYRVNTAYFIRVTTKDFGTILSETDKLPHYVTIDSIKPSVEQGAFNYTNLNLYFMDQTTGEDTYAFKGLYFSNNNEVSENPEYLHIPNNIFDDIGYDLKSISRTISIPKKISKNQQTQTIDKAKIILFHFSPALDAFVSSISQNEGTYGDVLIGAVPVISNIKEGQGVFGFFQSDTLAYIP